MDRGTPNERCQGRRFVCVGTTARTHSTLLRAGCDAPYLFANADVSDHNWPFLARGLVALEQTPVEAAPKAFGAANEEMQRIDSNEKTPSGCLRSGVKGYVASMKRTPWGGVFKNECKKSWGSFGTGALAVMRGEAKKAGAGYWMKCARYAVMSANMRSKCSVADGRLSESGAPAANRTSATVKSSKIRKHSRRLGT